MLKKKSQKLCYFCGKPGANSRDHIPPRGIFPTRPRGQLITVPSHRKCNELFSEDDTLFRDIVIVGSWRTKHGDRAWHEQVVPSWNKNLKAKRDLQKRLTPIWVKDPISGGAVLQHAVLADVSLFERQIDRFMRGLFYRRFGKPMPSDLKVEVHKLLPPEISMAELHHTMAQNGVKPIWVHVEPHVFSYYYAAAEEDTEKAIAFFVFFDTDVYMGTTKVGESRHYA